MNIVPTKHTRRLAAAMIRDAEEMAGADVVVKYANQVHRDQIPALIGVLLTATKQHKKLGRNPMPITYSEEERRRANRQYKNGERDDWTLEGYRQYQRVTKRAAVIRRGRHLGLAS